MSGSLRDEADLGEVCRRAVREYLPPPRFVSSEAVNLSQPGIPPLSCSDRHEERDDIDVPGKTYMGGRRGYIVYRCSLGNRLEKPLSDRGGGGRSVIWRGGP